MTESNVTWRRRDFSVKRTPRWGVLFPELWAQYQALITELQTTLFTNRGLAMAVCKKSGLSPSRVSQVISHRSPSLFNALRVAHALTALKAWDKRVSIAITIEDDDGQGSGSG